MITITAFQIGAFQFTGFQEAETVRGSGGWILMSLAARARRRALEAERRKQEEEERELVAYVPLPKLVPLRFTTKPIITDLSALAASKPPPDEQAELAEFRAFMELLVAMEEI